MQTDYIHFLPAALLVLAAVSCSPIVAEYTYRGTVSGTSSRTGARVLTLKEYKDGTVSGKLGIPAFAAAELYSCGSFGGRIDDRRITFYLTAMGDSYLGAKMAVMNSSSGTTVRYKGNISGNRRYLSGKWHTANDYRSYLRGGSFSFNLTHINGRLVSKPKRHNSTKVLPEIPAGSGNSFKVENEGSEVSPSPRNSGGFTVVAE